MSKQFEILCDSADLVAERLLGCELKRTLPDGQILRGRIVETEAYDQSDAASHSYKGRTPRTDVMFGPAGRLYVYFTYGMHYCCNVVTGADGQGAAVLIRGLEPLAGQPMMSVKRRIVDEHSRNLTNGPAKLCQAMDIDKNLNGHSLDRAPLELIVRPQLDHDNIVQTCRIGVSLAKDVPWRFYIKNNPYVSKL